MPLLFPDSTYYADLRIHLAEFCSKTGTRNPVSQEYTLGVRFACETFISQRNQGNNSTGNASTITAEDSDPSIDGIPFGGRDKLFPSKKAARQNAACEAITWLKENGYYSTVTGKPVARPDKVGNGGTLEGADDGVGEENGFVGMRKGMSYGQMVAGNLFKLSFHENLFHLLSLFLSFPFHNTVRH